MVLEFPGNAIRQETETKGKQMRQKDTKLSLLEEDMIGYIKSPKESKKESTRNKQTNKQNKKKTLPELISDFSVISG